MSIALIGSYFPLQAEGTRAHDHRATDNRYTECVKLPCLSFDSRRVRISCGGWPHTFWTQLGLSRLSIYPNVCQVVVVGEIEAKLLRGGTVDVDCIVAKLLEDDRPWAMTWFSRKATSKLH